MRRLLSCCVLLLAASVVLPLSAHAQAFRTYIASYGLDTNPCTVGSPCRLLPAALAAVHDGGEIWMLDSANYNPGTVTVTKSVSILAIPGQVGSIVSGGGSTALSIGGGITVTLRNVVIVNNANNPGTNGIEMTGSSKLIVEDSVIAPLGKGIYASAGGTISVSHTAFRNSTHGIQIAGNTALDVSDSKFSNISNYGVWVDGSIASTTATASVTDSIFTASYLGVFCWTQAAAVARATVTRSSFTSSAYGVASDGDGGGTAVAVVGSSMFGGTSTPLLQSGANGAVGSQGNNLNMGGVNSGPISGVAPI